MEHRFVSGELAGHAFGNLLLAALEESEGDLMAALAVASDLLGLQGQVLPATSQVVDLVAEVDDGTQVQGQVAISATTGVVRVHLEPESVAPPEVLAAVANADAVVLGPGSLYTSVLAAAVVPGVPEALGALEVPLVYVCNLHPQAHETDLYRVADHVAALERHGVTPDSVLYDPAQITGAEGISGAVPVKLSHSRGLAHDPELLASALGELLGI